MAQSSQTEQLDVLLDMLMVPLTNKVQINKKLIRDLLDVIEGYIRGILNSQGNYAHATLKANTPFASESAEKLRSTLSKAELVKNTHREHALPLRFLIEELYNQNFTTKTSLNSFLETNLVSVLITKEEQKTIDSPALQIRDSMPEDWDGRDIFARFKKANITIFSKRAA